MRRALAGLGMMAVLPFAAPQCAGVPAGDFDGVVHPPNLFVNVRPPPFLPIMHASVLVKTIHTPRTFELQAFLWEWKGRKEGYKLVRSWKRYKDELPKPGREKKFLFPDLRLGGPNDKADDFLTCEPGPYFMQFHGFGTSSTDQVFNFHTYFPYLQKRGVAKYAEAPPPKQAWQVTCTKTGQVPNPKGTSAPLLTVP